MKKIEALKAARVTPIEFEAFFDYRPYGEREYIFDHVWQQVDDKFYVADLQGTDWNGLQGELISASCRISTITTTLRKC